MATTPYDRLRLLVTRGTLAPGQPVTEAALAERLGVSRTPVRQAMQRLQAEGLLVVTGGGARPRVGVAPLDPDEARECYHAVGALEGRAARALAAWPGGARTGLADELAALDAAFQRAAAEGRGADVLHDRHERFHARLRAASAGPVVRALLATLAPRLERYTWFQGPLVRQAGLTFVPTREEHAAIVAAVRRGDADRLERVVRENWDNAAERFVAALQGAGGARPAGAPAPRARRR